MEPVCQYTHIQLLIKRPLPSTKYMCYTACVIFGMWLIWSTCFCWSEKDRLSIWHIRIIDQNKNKLQFNYYKYQRCKVCMDLNSLDICWPYVECSMISSEVFPIGRCLSFPPGVLPLRVWYSGMLGYSLPCKPPCFCGNRL